ncbi:MAG: Eco57I restriction-modification methylase domain-containing protein [Verrucomicrobia bacterium]|nr:Eco57I restriction-modification methylase domain-containing protein [Verrucomicrobiota bacterium]
MDDLFPTLRMPVLSEAVGAYAAHSPDERGAVYTRPEVVHGILDLAGYQSDQELHGRRILEPSFGAGDFLLPIVDRLLDAFARSGGTPEQAPDLLNAIRAVEISPEAFSSTKAAILRKLMAWGISRSGAEALTEGWLVQDDFLLTVLSGEFDHVVGNPPYVRQERIPEPLLQEYRRRYRTLYDRADLYVPFFERGLELLVPRGRLAFICANRWLKNKYGGPLREYAAARFSLRFFVDLAGTQPFQTDVIAYPAVTVFERGANAVTRMATAPEVSAPSINRLVAAMLNGGPESDPRIEELRHAVRGDAPWLLDRPERLRLLRQLEEQFPSLEEAGCKVGIGVATGADRVFIGKFDELPVEASRKIPLAVTRDLAGHRLSWGGLGVINPFLPDGSLADLDAYPQFGAYLRAHREAVAGRHCARRNHQGWYRTIDRIWPDLTSLPKLLIPDIKGEPAIAFDEGRLYPHHNFYFVTSREWDLRSLAVILRSSLAAFFVSSYCVRMSGGFLRFQAQYLRRIRVPRWSGLSQEQRAALTAAFESDDLNVIDAAAALAFRMDPGAFETVRSAAEEAKVPGSLGGPPPRRLQQSVARVTWLRDDVVRCGCSPGAESRPATGSTASISRVADALGGMRGFPALHPGG